MGSGCRDSLADDGGLVLAQIAIASAYSSEYMQRIPGIDFETVIPSIPKGIKKISSTGISNGDLRYGQGIESGAYPF